MSASWLLRRASPSSSRIGLAGNGSGAAATAGCWRAIAGGGAQTGRGVPARAAASPAAGRGFASSSSPSPAADELAFRRLESPPAGVSHFVRDLAHLRSVPVFAFGKKRRDAVSTVDLDPQVFGEPLRPDLLQRVVVWQRNRWRQGTSSAKTRAEVRGSTRKLRAQKGQGRARVGSARPPHFRGGGVAFPPKPRDFSIDLPKKVRRKALRVALSAKAAQGNLVIVDDLALDDPKTAQLVRFLKRHSMSEGGVVFIPGPEVDAAFRLSAHNVPLTDVLPSSGVQVYSLVHRKHAVVSLSGLHGLYDRLADQAVEADGDERSRLSELD